MADLKEYWGFKEIGARMGWKSSETTFRHIQVNMFPAYKRSIRPNGKGWVRPMWYTNDNLITLWELKQADLCRAKLKHRKSQHQRNVEQREANKQAKDSVDRDLATTGIWAK